MRYTVERRREEARKTEVNYKFYRTLIPIFAEGRACSHVVDKILEHPDMEGLSIKTQCKRAFEYDSSKGFDIKSNTFIVDYPFGASRRKVYFYTEGKRFVGLANRCMRCGFNSPELTQHTQLGTRSIATSTIVQCIEGSELEQFVLNQPNEFLG